MSAPKPIFPANFYKRFDRPGKINFCSLLAAVAASSTIHTIQVFLNANEQRCCVHTTANVLDKLPKGKQPNAKSKIHEIWTAETDRAVHDNRREVQGLEGVSDKLRRYLNSFDDSASPLTH